MLREHLKSKALPFPFVCPWPIACHSLFASTSCLDCRLLLDLSPAINQYPPYAQCYSMPPVGRSHVHHVVPPPRPGVTPRKRPKYTRSKTGCLTCRVKKIKVSCRA